MFPMLCGPMPSPGFDELAQQVKQVAPDADLIDIDAMDACFVPLHTTGPVVVQAVKGVTSLPRAMARSWRT